MVVGVEAVATATTTMMKNVTALLRLLLGFHTMNDECVICLARITGDTATAILGCRHVFHLQCVYTWFQEGGDTCPCCRQVVFDLPLEDDVCDDNESQPSDNDTITVYSSEGEEDEENENENVNYLNNLHLQITVSPAGRSVVVGLTG